MIICDEHSLAFVHIPKCAGTSVRERLQNFDTRGGKFAPRVVNHQQIGRLDMTHIPLFILREHFCEDFEALEEYWSIAVIRDPYTRFASSVTQHINMYSHQTIQSRSAKEIQNTIKSSMDYLSRQSKGPHLLPAEYIHFQKQVDYVSLDGARVINKLYLLEDIEILFADAGRRLRKNLDELTFDRGRTWGNRTFVYRNEVLRKLLETSRPYLSYLNRFLSERVKEDIRNIVYVPREQRLEGIFQTDEVKDFIQEYYADDIGIYNHLIKSKRDNSW